MKRVVIHLLFWTAICIWRAKGDYYLGAPLYKFIWHNVLRLPPMVIATYVVIYQLLPRFIIEKKEYWKFALGFAITFGLSFTVDEWIIKSPFMFEWLDITTHEEYLVFKPVHPFRNSFALLSIIGLATMIRFFKLFREKEQRESQLIQAQLETQHAFLKAQVNPHFLFNALNNLYSMAVQKKETEIADGLENLSGIMHYLTYESGSKFVPLAQEIQLIENYIAIQQLRIAEDDEITISFNVAGDIQGIQIAPVILLPLVENAFKHGMKPTHKSLISIQLAISGTRLYFKINNTVFEKSAQEISEKGIGLENVHKRLELIYPEQFTLNSQAENGYFQTILQLPII
ncbi:MAG: sensor histidine kinase [Saprospiraceae bacterium]